MKTRLAALLTAAMMLTSAAAIPPLPTGAAEDPILGVLPDWVPQNFADALQFYNTYGKTRAEEHIICLVRPAVHFRKDDYHSKLSGTMTQINTPAGSEPKFYTLDIPEKPDPEDAGALAAYEEYCQKLGVPSDDYSFFEKYQNRKTQPAFEVSVYQVLDGYDLTIEWMENNGDEIRTIGKFSFEYKDSTIRENDIYEWLPDSLPEFKTFRKQNGTVSLQSNIQGLFIAYAASVNPSTGESLKMEQKGDGKVEEFITSNCTPFELIPKDGGSSQSVILYAPTADGEVDITWTLGKEWSDEEPSEIIHRIYEFTDNGTNVRGNTEIVDPQTVFTLLDADTGEVIDMPGVSYIREDVKGDPYAGEVFYMRTNPCSFKGVTKFDPEESYYVQLGSDAGWYLDPKFEVTTKTEERLEVSCRLKWNPSGDADGNGTFGLTDIIRLQRHLISPKKVKLDDPDAVDFCRDHQTDVFDLGMMKRALFGKKQAGYVEPDVPVLYGGPLDVIADGLKIYAGPDTKSEVLGVIPRWVSIEEKGYQKDNQEWVFTEYRGISGWIRTVDDQGNRTVMYGAQVDKPVIYLYPEKETDVHVELTLTESDLATTYPKYKDGWDVTASPDGTLLNKADGSHHRYLFWDSTNCRTRFDFSKGFCVAGADTETFLKEKLTAMGLTESEMNEFIVYWLPRMEHNAFNLISFQGDAYTNSAKLNITPAPDSECRVFMAYVPLESAVEIEPQTLPTFERKGFAVVEWGGTEIVSGS
jgi:hypothetical protein